MYERCHLKDHLEEPALGPSHLTRLERNCSGQSSGEGVISEETVYIPESALCLPLHYVNDLTMNPMNPVKQLKYKISFLQRRRGVKGFAVALYFNDDGRYDTAPYTEDVGNFKSMTS